jgi:hypothetical protein
VRRTPEAIHNVVRMMRTIYPNATFLISEGASDSQLFRHFIDDVACRIVVAMGRHVAERAIAMLEADNVAGVLTIVDSDFDRLEGTKPISRNVLCTDSHDLETMMFGSPALLKVAGAFGSADKIATLLGTSDLKSILLSSALPIGYLRWWSLKKNLGFNFEGLAFGQFIDLNSLSVDVDAFIAELHNHSHKWSPSASELLEHIRTMADEHHDPWQVCCGHDLSEILALGFRKAIGTQKSIHSTGEIVERSLRLAYEFAFFEGTELCAAVWEWEVVNTPFRVLKSGARQGLR